MYEADATSAAHRALARRVGAASAVLLKNDNGALPLRPGARVVLAGSACSQRHVLAESKDLDWRAGDYYVLGGSGAQHADLTLALALALALGLGLGLALGLALALALTLIRRVQARRAGAPRGCVPRWWVSWCGC